MADPIGVVCVYSKDGRVIASASDFATDGYGGCSLQEAQTIRARRSLCHAVVDAYCSRVVLDALSTHDCEQIVGKLGGTMTDIPIGHGNG